MQWRAPLEPNSLDSAPAQGYRRTNPVLLVEVAPLFKISDGAPYIIMITVMDGPE